MLIILGLLLALVLAGYSWYTRHATFADVLDGKVQVEPLEMSVLEGLLVHAGLDAQRVRVVETAPDEPCWGYAQWSRLDDWLRVYRQFGPFPGLTNCVGIDDGHVVSLSLVNTRLTDVHPLVQLPALHRLYLYGNRIERLAGVAASCAWTHVHLASNQLTDISAITGCVYLEELDVAHNRLAALPSLHALGRLTRLDASNNEIADVSDLAGHPALRDVNLYGNHLVSLTGFKALPRLERLDVSGNQITTLHNLSNLPALRYLRAGSNQLTSLDAEVLAALPALREVSLTNNHLRAVPEGYVAVGSSRQPTKVHPVGRGLPTLDLRQNPIAETLEADAVARHDGTAIHHVAALPRGRGRFQGSTRRGRERRGAFSSGLDVSGTATWFEGAQSISFDLHHGVVVTATASVEKGRLRLYLKDRDGGYRYAEAIPGKPLCISGSLISLGRGYFIYLESVDGRVEGIRWAVSN